MNKVCSTNLYFDNALGTFLTIHIICFIIPPGEVHCCTGARWHPQEGNLGGERPAHTDLLPKGQTQNRTTSHLQGGKPQGRRSLPAASSCYTEQIRDDRLYCGDINIRIVFPLHVKFPHFSRKFDLQDELALHNANFEYMPRFVYVHLDSFHLFCWSLSLRQNSICISFVQCLVGQKVTSTAVKNQGVSYPHLFLLRFPEGTHFIIYVYVISPPVDQWDYVKPLAVECIVSRMCTKQTNRCPTRNKNPKHHKVVSVLLLQVKMFVLKNTCYTEFFNITLLTKLFCSLFKSKVFDSSCRIITLFTIFFCFYALSNMTM